MKNYLLSDFLAYATTINNVSISLNDAIIDFERGMEELGVEQVNDFNFDLNETSDFNY